MWFFDWGASEEEQLQEQIKKVVNGVESAHYNLYNWVTIINWEFEIYIETLSDLDTVSSSSYVKFRGSTLFNKEKNMEFLTSLVRILDKKSNNAKEIQKNSSELSRKLLITEALAVITEQEVTNASKEVKDEFDPIFTKVKRVMEITKELEGIRREFSII